MEDQFNTKANSLKEVIRDTPYDVLQQRVYMCFANGCLLLTSFLKSKGEKGWAGKLLDDADQPMLSFKEQSLLEKHLGYGLCYPQLEKKIVKIKREEL